MSRSGAEKGIDPKCKTRHNASGEKGLPSPRGKHEAPQNAAAVRARPASLASIFSQKTSASSRNFLKHLSFELDWAETVVTFRTWFVTVTTLNKSSPLLSAPTTGRDSSTLRRKQRGQNHNKPVTIQIIGFGPYCSRG